MGAPVSASKCTRVAPTAATRSPPSSCAAAASIGIDKSCLPVRSSTASDGVRDDQVPSGQKACKTTTRPSLTSTGVPSAGTDAIAGHGHAVESTRKIDCVLTMASPDEFPTGLPSQEL